MYQWEHAAWSVPRLDSRPKTKNLHHCAINFSSTTKARFVSRRHYLTASRSSSRCLNIGIAWGIVTNKATRYTLPLAKALGFDITAACVVCGDTCERAKPHPDPLLHAANLIQIAPENCLYIGDDLRDIQAANSANMRGVVANYGYLGGSDPATWNAAASINTPLELIELL